METIEQIDSNKNGQQEDSLDLYFTKEQQEFVPTKEELFISNSKGETQRLIFYEPIELTKEELKELDGFREYLSKNKLVIPEGYDDGTRLLLRYLQGMHWDYPKTYQAVQDHYKWKKETFPIDTSKFEKFLDQGIVYAYQRDKKHRVVIVINVEKVLSSKIEFEQLLGLADYFLDFVLNKCMLPSKIENWTIIVDFNNVGLSQIPKSLLQGVISSMQKNYRGRLFRLFAINVHWLLRGLWKVAKNLLDEFTLSKIHIYGTDYPEHLLHVIDENKLEKKFGGKLENKETGFFPPQMI